MNNNPEQTPHPHARKVLALSLSIIASAAFLWVIWAASDIDLGRIKEAVRGADIWMLATAFVLSALSHTVLGADKLWRVLNALEVRLPYTETLAIRLGSFPIKVLMPFKSGEAVNIVYLTSRRHLSASKATGAILFERGLNVIGATFWLLTGALVSVTPEANSTALLASAAFIVYTAFFYVTPLHSLMIKAAGKIHKKLGAFAAGVLSPFARISPFGKLFFILYGMLFQLRPLIVCYLLFRAVGITPPVNELVVFTSLAMFAGHIPSIMGIGPREAAFVTLYAGMAPESVLFSIGLLLTLSVQVLPMLIGLPWVPWLLKRVIRKESAGPASAGRG